VTGKQDPQNVKDIIDALVNKNKSFQGAWNRLRNYSWDIGGILLLVFSVMTLVATLFPSLVEGSVLLRWTNIIRLGLGWGSVFVVLSGIVLGIWMLKQQAGEPYMVTWVRIFALEAAIFCLIALFTVLGGHSITRAREGLDGGLVGWGAHTGTRIGFSNPRGDVCGRKIHRRIREKSSRETETANSARIPQTI